MESQGLPTSENRPLSHDEYQLALWMLQHGEPEAMPFIDQLERASVTPWRCPCGCASINFAIDGHPIPHGGVHPLGDYVFDDGGKVSGAFIFESSGLLAGIEVYALEGDAPRRLPLPSELRPFGPAVK